MDRLLLAFAMALAAGAAGCSTSSGSGAGPADACAPIDSACGQPCRPGNSLGVGVYCGTSAFCPDAGKATICSYLGDPTTHFCTFRCSVPAADAGGDAGDAGLPFPTDCGEGATCECNGGGNCGCTPNACLGK